MTAFYYFFYSSSINFFIPIDPFFFSRTFSLVLLELFNIRFVLRKRKLSLLFVVSLVLGGQFQNHSNQRQAKSRQVGGKGRGIEGEKGKGRGRQKMGRGVRGGGEEQDILAEKFCGRHCNVLFVFKLLLPLFVVFIVLPV